jgi:DMSO/TMAO reductase YedYZ heme-binding membrane subunit
VFARRRNPASAAGGTTRPQRGRWVLVAVLLAAGCGTLAAGGTGDRAILAAVQRFMLLYSGVFALIALTVAVAAGLVATDRIVMPPAGRVMSQAVHRALSLAAVGFLATHVVMEELAHRSRPIDAVGPFLASGHRVYLGLGTLASDLVLLVLVTGVARRGFAGWPAAWRAVHVTAYLAWPLAILHGLLTGRHPEPYVYWGYGGCLAAVALALAIRLVATTRSRAEVAAHPVPDAGVRGAGQGPRAEVPAARQPAASWPAPPPPPRPARPAATQPRAAAQHAARRDVTQPRAARGDGTQPRGGQRAARPDGTLPIVWPDGTGTRAWPGGTQPDTIQRAAEP